MQNETFEPGQELYLENGNQVEYICAVEYGHIVREVYDMDGEPWTSDPMFVHHIFTDPPKVKQEQRVAELDAEIEEKEKRLREVCSEIWDAQNSQKKMLDVLTKNEALAQLENVLNGGITHVVVLQYKDWDNYPLDAKAYRDTYAPPTFNLSVDFKTKTPKWGYKAAGDDYLRAECFPFPCEAEAVAFVQQKILEEASEEKLAGMNPSCIELAIRNAVKHKVQLPDFFLAAHRNNQLKAAKEAKVKAQDELDKANKALAELGGGDDAE